MSDTLNSLIDKLNRFVNGDDKTIIATASGALRSLKHIERIALSNRYTSPIRDVDTLASLRVLVGQGNQPQHACFRVYADPQAGVNGIWGLVGGEVVKRTYADIVDLKDTFAPATSIKDFEFENPESMLFTVDMPQSALRVEATSFNVSVTYAVEEAGYSGLVFAEYHVLITAGTTVEVHPTLIHRGAHRQGELQSTGELSIVPTVSTSGGVHRIAFRADGLTFGVSVKGKGKCRVSMCDPTRVR